MAMASLPLCLGLVPSHVQITPSIVQYASRAATPYMASDYLDSTIRAKSLTSDTWATRDSAESVASMVASGTPMSETAPMRAPTSLVETYDTYLQEMASRLAYLDHIRDDLPPEVYAQKRLEILSYTSQARALALADVNDENARLSTAVEAMRTIGWQAGGPNARLGAAKAATMGTDTRSVRILAPLVLAGGLVGLALKPLAGTVLPDPLLVGKPPLNDKAAAKLKQYFPTAMPDGEAERRIFNVLAARGYTKDNTLFGHSTCAAVC